MYINCLKELISDLIDEQYEMVVDNGSSEEQVKRRGPIGHVKDCLVQIFYRAATIMGGEKRYAMGNGQRFMGNMKDCLAYVARNANSHNCI
jgi:hypothetical protein